LATQISTIELQERPTAPLLLAIVLMLVALIPAAAVLAVPIPILAGVGGILGLIVLCLRPDYATLLVVAVVYSNAAVVAVRFHDVPFALAAGSVFLLCVPLGYFLLIRREPLIVPRAVPWIFGFLIVMTLSTLFARNSSAAASGLSIFVTEGLLLYLLVVNSVRDERLVLRIVWVLLAVGAGLAALTLHQEVTGNLSNDYLGFAQTGGDSTGLLPGEAFRQRPAGPLDGPNRYAQVLVLLLPLTFAVVWGKFSRWATMAAILAALLLSIGVALTLSRGAAVGFALVVALMFALRYLRLRNLAILGVAVVGLLIAFPQYGARLQSLETVPGIADEGVATDGSVRSRLTEMAAAALVFADHPFIGVGPDEFQSYYLEYAEEFGLRVKQDERAAHNLYVGIAADFGILGSFFFFGAIAVTIRDLARMRSRLLYIRPQLAHLAGGFMLSLVAYLTTGIFLHLAMERYLWLMMALGATIVVLGSRYVTDPDAVPVPTGGAAASQGSRLGAVQPGR
jgi:putative inorganic carbon (hco3(-)) transporter